MVGVCLRVWLKCIELWSAYPSAVGADPLSDAEDSLVEQVLEEAPAPVARSGDSCRPAAEHAH